MKNAKSLVGVHTDNLSASKIALFSVENKYSKLKANKLV